MMEEERFLETIEGGLTRLDGLLGSGATVIPGEEVFKLYDTFGFPLDLTMLIAEERGASVDVAGFETALNRQRQRSRDARATQQGGGPAVQVDRTGEWRELRPESQQFVGYESDDVETDLLAFRQEGDRVEVLLRENPFYVESGGQVSDTGIVEGQGWDLPVDQVRKDPRGTVVAGTFGEEFEPTSTRARVDAVRRRNIERNHSATHLVHAALRKYLGTHVRQQGSLVDENHLRFDFSHHGPINPEMLQTIEREVNARIWDNVAVTTRRMAYPDALALGAMALFSEKYGDVVRVVFMGDSSIELCGGTHVRSTGQIGLFQFRAQGGVAAGVRRIEAVTGPEAYVMVEALQTQLTQAARTLKAQPEHLVRKLEQLIEERERLAGRVAEMVKGGGAGAPQGQTLAINGVTVTLAESAAENRDEIAAMADAFRSGKTRAALILFGTGERAAVHVALTDDLVKAGRKAGDLVSRIAAVGGGKGGGRPHFASGSLGDASRLAAAREAAGSIVQAWLEGS
jgi:alanyl-tRNA synthetase